MAPLAKPQPRRRGTSPFFEEKIPKSVGGGILNDSSDLMSMAGSDRDSKPKGLPVTRHTFFRRAFGPPAVRTLRITPRTDLNLIGFKTCPLEPPGVPNRAQIMGRLLQRAADGLYPPAHFQTDHEPSPAYEAGGHVRPGVQTLRLLVVIPCHGSHQSGDDRGRSDSLGRRAIHSGGKEIPQDSLEESTPCRSRGDLAPHSSSYAARASHNLPQACAGRTFRVDFASGGTQI